jgi:hypothetical protein
MVEEIRRKIQHHNFQSRRQDYQSVLKDTHVEQQASEAKSKNSELKKDILQSQKKEDAMKLAKVFPHIFIGKPIQKDRQQPAENPTSANDKQYSPEEPQTDKPVRKRL